VSCDSQSIGPYVVGEKPPELRYSFLGSDGAPLDLTGYSAKFLIREKYGTAVTLNATVTVPTSGTVAYTWTGAEFPSPGEYSAEFWTGDGTHRYASVLITFNVRGPIGPVPAV
jgi:hypothetical protein